jgi:nucleotide-binding universal stress UspA family protein
MLELFSSDTTIVLGLDLSGSEAKLIKTAASLAKKTGSRLVLVHALRPEGIYVSTGEDFTLAYEAQDHRRYDNAFHEAEQHLLALRDRLPPEIPIEIKILRDYPENALEDVSQQVKGSLIVCGIGRQNNGSTGQSAMSTAFSLMANSKFPVMVIPHTTEIDFAAREHNVLVADNMHEEGFHALQAALGLCRSIGYRQLIHLHVTRTSYRDINESVEKIKLAMIEGRLPFNPEFETDIYLKQIKDELKQLMHDRLELADKDFAKGLHWSPRVKFGSPPEELQHVARETRSDILVFGKHHFIHPRELTLGAIPYPAMIEPHVASIIVPS